MRYQPNIFGRTLRERRTAARKTLADVAAECAVSVVYISDLERGARIASPELGERLALMFDIHTDVLYYVRGELPPDFPVEATVDQIRRGFSNMRRAMRFGEGDEAAARRTATPRPARQDAGRENNERQKNEG